MEWMVIFDWGRRVYMIGWWILKFDESLKVLMWNSAD